MTPARIRLAHGAAWFVIAVPLPWLLEAELMAWMRSHEVATTLLGAAAGSSRMAVGSMALAMVLRIYTVVLVPAIVAAWLVTTALRGLLPAKPLPLEEETDDSFPEEFEPPSGPAI